MSVAILINKSAHHRIMINRRDVMWIDSDSNQAIQLIFRPPLNVNYAIGFSLSSRDTFHNFPHNNKRKTVSNHLRTEIAS